MGLRGSILNRWFAAPRDSARTNGGEQQGSAVKEADFIVLPPAASDSWRSWLMTGVRRGPFDRRRIKGAHQGLKKMLIEGTTNPADGPQPWNDFSSAMVRQSVDEALNALPSEQKQTVKLAYFGGLTNKEIAQRLGVTDSVVRRMLGNALAAVAAHVETGRAAVRRAVYAIAGWLTARALFDATRRSAGPAVDHLLQAAAVVTVGVAAAGVLVTNPASPAQLSQPNGRGSINSAAAGGSGQDAAAKHLVLPAAPALPVVSPVVSTALPHVPNAPPVLPLPVNLPVPTNLPIAVPTPPTSLPVLPKP
jgi:RNA polymerase sigma factor (sigma-70 family)